MAHWLSGGANQQAQQNSAQYANRNLLDSNSTLKLGHASPHVQLISGMAGHQNNALTQAGPQGFDQLAKLQSLEKAEDNKDQHNLIIQ